MMSCYFVYSFPDALHAAEAFAASCYIPLLMEWPRLWVRHKTPYMNCAIDGELALRVGDGKIFKPVHKDGKTVRTLYSYILHIIDNFS